jgi:hypothetical protein
MRAKQWCGTSENEAASSSVLIDEVSNRVPHLGYPLPFVKQNWGRILGDYPRISFDDGALGGSLESADRRAALNSRGRFTHGFWTVNEDC